MNTVMVKVERDGVVKHEAFRVLSPEETKERARLNILNTACAIRARALAGNAEQNGK